MSLSRRYIDLLRSYSLGRIVFKAARCLNELAPYCQLASNPRDVSIELFEGIIAEADCPHNTIRLGIKTVDELSEDELALVMGHELAHLSPKLRFGNYAIRLFALHKRWSKIGFILTVPAVIILSVFTTLRFVFLIQPAYLAASYCIQHILHWLSCNCEYAADEIGIKTLMAAGFDGEKALCFFRKWEENEKDTTKDLSKSYIRYLQSMDAHPPINLRIMRIERIVNGN